MNPYKAYQRGAEQSTSRIDAIITLYEQLTQRLEKALDAVKQGDSPAAQQLLHSVNLIIGALASGIDENAGELGQSLLRLFGFISQSIKSVDQTGIAAALKLCRILYEGYLTIRSEAAQMERNGEIPSFDRLRAFETKA